MADFEGKAAIVTGGSRGIGAAIVGRLAAGGAKVVVGYSQNAQAAREIVAQVRESGGEAAAVQADMGEPAQIEAMFLRAMEAYGRLDVLVNNAAVSEFRPLAKTDGAFYERMFAVNARGPLLAMRHAASHFGQAGGRIVNISSGITRSPTPEAAVYAASKAALETMTACLAMELGPRHITVNAVAPGVTATDMLHQVISAERQQIMASETALRRLGRPEDIADVVAFLCSEAARWITGADYFRQWRTKVDDGQYHCSPGVLMREGTGNSTVTRAPPSSRFS